MLGLNDVLQFMKSKDTGFSHYYIGKLNNKHDNSLGIYNLRGVSDSYMAIGGDEPTKCQSKNISLLIHGNKNKVQTETLATNLYKILKSVRNEKFGKYDINFIKMLYGEPIDVDVDVNGVYEYVIEIKIYYTQGDE